MSRLSIGQKVQRVVRFLFALRSPRIVASLGQFGFKQEDVEEGWSLLRAVARTRLDTPLETAAVDPSIVSSLDAWENKWFVVADATLERHAPAARDWLFRNLQQTEGVEVIVSVGTFVERWEQLDKSSGLGAAGKAAKKLVEARGLTKTVLATAKELLASAEKVDGPLPDLDQLATEDGQFREAEDAMWAWYLEWSRLARAAIRNRALLRQLGFLRTVNGREEEVDDTATEPVAPTAPTK